MSPCQRPTVPCSVNRHVSRLGLSLVPVFISFKVLWFIVDLFQLGAGSASCSRQKEPHFITCHPCKLGRTLSAVSYLLHVLPLSIAQSTFREVALAFLSK